jgi:hypothetical protein
MPSINKAEASRLQIILTRGRNGDAAEKELSLLSAQKREQFISNCSLLSDFYL